MMTSQQEKKILKTIEKFSQALPKFPDGRIDYSKADTAPVISLFIKFQEKILLLKRSDKVRNYPGRWNVVSGYLDELRPVREKILEEMEEELSLGEEHILSIHPGQPFQFTDQHKTFIVHPFLVKLKNKPVIRLDWEHTEYKWIEPEELKNFETVPKLERGLERVLKTSKKPK